MMRMVLSILTAGLVSLAVQAQAQEEDKLQRGEYLAKIMDCTGCHTTGALAGKPDGNLYLAGSDIGFEIPGLAIVYPPNLTPDPETGLGRWSEADMIAAIRTGMRPDGRQLIPVMPYPSYATLTDADAAALVAYLRSLKPIRHAAPKLIKPGEPATAPYLSVVVPKK
jgi:mono/diheme cytochrome c family protein